MTSIIARVFSTGTVIEEVEHVFAMMDIPVTLVKNAMTITK
jgi:hypothetical protein